MRQFRNGILLAAITLLQACGNPFNLSESCDTGFYATEAGQQMHWPDGHRIDFEMHKSVPGNFRDVIKSSSLRYNESFEATRLKVIDSELKTPTFSGSVGKVSGDNINAIYWVRDSDWAWSESDPSAVAMTVVNFSKDGITEADIFYKASVFARATSTDATTEAVTQNFFSFSTPSAFAATISAPAYNIAATNTYFFEHQAYMVSVHEFGHAIGRCHSDNRASIMYPEVSAGTEEERAHPLSEIDLDILSQIYSLIE